MIRCLHCCLWSQTPPTCPPPRPWPYRPIQSHRSQIAAPATSAWRQQRRRSQQRSKRQRLQRQRSKRQRLQRQAPWRSQCPLQVAEPVDTHRLCHLAGKVAPPVETTWANRDPDAKQPRRGSANPIRCGSRTSHCRPTCHSPCLCGRGLCRSRRRRKPHSGTRPSRGIRPPTLRRRRQLGTLTRPQTRHRRHRRRRWPRRRRRRNLPPCLRRFQLQAKPHRPDLPAVTRP